MLPRDGQQVLNAEYSVETEGNQLALILESSGGGPPAERRNGDYRRAMLLLLIRLRNLDAILVDALVDSANTRRAGIPEHDRRLIWSPIRLREYRDLTELRRHLTIPQARIARTPNAKGPGNTSKRIKLRLIVPGYGPTDADRLAAALASAEPTGDTLLSPLVVCDGQHRLTALAQMPQTYGSPEVDPSVEGALEAIANLRVQEGPDGLEKRHQPLTLLWAVGRLRRGGDRMTPWPIINREVGQLIERFGRATDRRSPHLPFLALSGTGLWELSARPPRKGKAGDSRLKWLNVTKPWIRGGFTDAIHELFATSDEAVVRFTDALLLEHFEDVDEAALLQAVGLRDLADAIVEQRRRYLLLHAADVSEPGEASDTTFQGALGYTAVVARRREQAVLRRLLLPGAIGACALCGAILPEVFLVAAHIKKRSHCSDDERRKLDDIAMLACTLGCDALYEHGYVAVAEDGTIMISSAVLEHPALAEHAHQRLRGRRSSRWSQNREAFFAWHRERVYRG